MNYLHNNNNNNRPLRSTYIHTYSLFHAHSPATLYYISPLLFSLFSVCMFFFLLLITLHRNIFVLGPAQLCISRNDDGSYDVTVLAGRRGLCSLNGKGCLSRKIGGCDFNGSQSHISFTFSLWIHVIIDKCHLDLLGTWDLMNNLLLLILKISSYCFYDHYTKLKG